MAEVAPAATSEPAADLVSMIMSAAEPIWKKISAALKVATREEAVQLVQADPQAAAKVMQLVKGQTALTQPAPEAQPTALTSGINVPSAAERIYGSGKAKLQY
jgi:hypothetical protein